MAKATKKKPAAKAKSGVAKKAVAKKAGAKKAVVKKAVAKKAAAKKVKRKASAALMKEMTPSALLAAVVGSKPLPRGQIIKKLWAYIKKFDLQDKINKRLIHADEKLKAIFGGKSPVNMFEMTKLVSKHIS
jgi:chromatin remodeling complex protein RSC6